MLDHPYILMVDHALGSLTRILRLILVLACLGIAGWCDAASTSLIQNEDGLLLNIWTTKDGLPQNRVVALAQTPDGYLWVATQYGLARFDGVRFQNFALKDGLPDMTLTALLVDRDGVLWVGTAGNRLYRWDNCRFEALSVPCNGNITSLAQDPEGRLLVGTQFGLNRWQEGKMEFFGIDEGLPNYGLRTVCVCRSGEILLGTVNGGLYELKNDRIVEVPVPFPIPEIRPVYALLDDSKGRLWMSVGNGYVMCREGGRWTNYSKDQGIPFAYITVLKEDRDGTVWAGSLDDGLSYFKNGRFQAITRDHGLTDDAVQSLLPDATGGLWVGMRAGGLGRLASSQVVAYGKAQGLTNAFINSLCETPGGTLWVAIEGNFMCRREKGRFVPFNVGEMAFIPDLSKPAVTDSVKAVMATSDGSLWWSRYRSVYRLPPNAPQCTVFDQSSTGDWLRRDNVYHMCEDSSNRLWLATRGGHLRFFENGKIQPAPAVWMVRDAITALATGPDGTVFVGTNTRGVQCLQGNEITVINRARGLPGHAVSALHVDDEGTLWIGTAYGGLSRWRNGQLMNFMPMDGMNHSITQILADNDGNLWLGTMHGILRVQRAELETQNSGREVKLHPLVFGEAEGMATEECSSGATPNCHKDRNGVLYFATINGVVSINPSRFQAPVPPPKAMIENVLLDGVSLGDCKSRGETTPAVTVATAPGRHFLEFHYTATGGRTPERVRFRYQLIGLDAAWVDAGTRRDTSYAYLPPGKYQFSLMASNGDGVWSHPPVSTVPFIILPPWWATWWFRSLASIVLLGLALAIYRHRVSAIKKKSLRLELEVARRTRALSEGTVELARTNADLVAAKSAAEAANSAKSLFLANMSHELRTPLNAILGFARIMFRDPEVSTSQKENLDIILKSGEHLLTLINSVLEIARIEAGKVTAEPMATDLSGLINDLLILLKLRAEAKGLELFFDESSSFPRFVKTDPAKLRQILINLLGNAVKFTNQGRISLKLSVLSLNHGSGQLQLMFEISDTGPGIAPEDIPNLFKAFSQAAAAKGQEGSGLGLTIAKEYVELLGGSISVESTPGRGSTFRFSVLGAAVNETDIALFQGTEATVEAIENAIGKRILIVEDQEENRLLLSHLLSPYGFDLRVACNGRDAITVACEWHPHVILMDRRMPVMDGLTATRELRKLPLAPQPVILAVSAHAYQEEQQEMLDAGCDGFLRKPFGEHELFDLLARHLEIRVHYAATVPPAAAVRPLTPEVFASLAGNLRVALEHAITRLDMEAVENVVGRIQRQNPELGIQLKHHTDKLAYSEILEVLRQAPPIQ